MTPNKRRKIAIVGSGISGLGAAYLLHSHHDITVYEKNAYTGGHSRTVTVATSGGNVPVDTGFIVFNKRNYPHLTSLFEHLGVPVKKSNMSFGVSVENGWLEYGTQNLFNVFTQKKNLFRRDFWRMLSDILRFNAYASRDTLEDTSVSLGDYLENLSLGPWFKEYYLLAMGGAIWSTPLTDMLRFPASTFLRFFKNHGLLTVTNQPQWFTVAGGSREYVARLARPYADRIRLSTGVARISRQNGKIVVTDTRGNEEIYDDAVLACHANQALALIAEPTESESQILGAFSYQPNRAVLHRDASLMPRRRSAWSSWVYLSETEHDANPAVSLTYWMNNLQPLSTDLNIFVTLNPGREPRADLVYDDHIFQHPVFDEAAIAAQKRIGDIQGKNGLWFCGAYQRYGFHEDGLGSAVDMAARMGVAPAWN